MHLVAGDAVRTGPADFAGPPPSGGVVSVASALDSGGRLLGVRSRRRVDVFHTRVGVLAWNRTFADAAPVRVALQRWIRAALGPPAS